MRLDWRRVAVWAGLLTAVGAVDWCCWRWISASMAWLWGQL